MTLMFPHQEQEFQALPFNAEVNTTIQSGLQSFEEDIALSIVRKIQSTRYFSENVDELRR